jgi:hypothetical protein
VGATVPTSHLEEKTMGIARISCGSYLAGHDVHSIAVNRTYHREGIDGTLSWDTDHAVLTTAAGDVFPLYNHRPDILVRAVEASSSATLLEASHLLWVHIDLPPSEENPDGRVAKACVNVSDVPVEACAAQEDLTGTDSDTWVIEGGN